MTLQEQIQADLKTAMLNKDENKRNLIRVILAEFPRVSKIKELTDDQVVKVLKKMLENAKEMSNQVEIDILETYLPKELTKEELTTLIQKIIVDNGIVSIKEMGKVMGVLKTSGALYDGKVASEIIKTLLK
jgi:uncharacterized protein YqeY